MEQVKDDKVNAHQKKVDSCQSENRSRTCSKLSKNIKTDSPQSIHRKDKYSFRKRDDE